MASEEHASVALAHCASGDCFVQRAVSSFLRFFKLENGDANVGQKIRERLAVREAFSLFAVWTQATGSREKASRLSRPRRRTMDAPRHRKLWPQRCNGSEQRSNVCAGRNAGIALRFSLRLN